MVRGGGWGGGRRYWQSQATSSGCACYRSFVSSGSCLAVFSKREREMGRARRKRQNGSQSQWRTPPSWATYKGPGQAACLRSESEVCQSPLGGYATLLFVFRFLFFSAFLSFFTVFLFFVLFFRFVSFWLLFCFVLCACKKKKHFNLQMRNKFQTKAQSFPLQINF